jgi:hypothetical protein
MGEIVEIVDCWLLIDDYKEKMNRDERDPDPDRQDSVKGIKKLNPFPIPLIPCILVKFLTFTGHHR